MSNLYPLLSFLNTGKVIVEKSCGRVTKILINMMANLYPLLKYNKMNSIQNKNFSRKVIFEESFRRAKISLIYYENKKWLIVTHFNHF
jgi:hypothetical protein